MQASTLFKKISNNVPKLTSLLLYHYKLSAEDFIQAFKLLENNTVVKKLTCPIDTPPESLYALADMLAVNTTINNLVMGGTNFTEETLRYFIDKVASNNHLKYLDMGSSLTTEAMGNYVVEGLQCATNLSKLCLADCNITNKQLYPIARLVAKRKLKKLNLSYNPLSDDGINEFLLTTAKDSRLHELALHDCQLSDVCAETLGNFLEKNHSLKTLFLGGNRFSDLGARYLSDGLKLNSSLLHLILYNNQISDDGVGFFAETLLTNSKLALLNLQKNPFTAEGAQLLAQTVGKRQSPLIVAPRVHCKINIMPPRPKRLPG